MVRTLLLPTLLLAAGLAAAAAAPRKELPSFIRVCKRNDPKLDECVTKAIDTLRPQLIKGIPEMSVPSIEPLVVPVLHVTPPGGSLRATATNVKMFGVGAYRIGRFKVHLNETTLELQVTMTFPQLNFEAEYEVDGSILSLPLRGRGPLTASVSTVNAKMVILGRLHKRKSDTYLRFHDGQLNLVNVESLKVKLENLFNGDKTLGEATNTALNQNPEELLELLKPDVEKSLIEFVLNTGNKLAALYTWDQLVPPE